MNFPKTDRPHLCLVLVVLAFTWSLKSVTHSSYHNFTQFLLVLADPACLLWVSLCSSVGFLLCYTPHLKVTFYTFVTGRFHEDISTASLCICVCRNWRSPSGSLCLCCTALQPCGGEGICSPCAASCWFDSRCLKGELCVVEAVAEKCYVNLHSSQVQRGLCVFSMS